MTYDKLYVGRLSQATHFSQQAVNTGGTLMRSQLSYSTHHIINELTNDMFMKSNEPVHDNST